jgi:hypothetical protein
MAMIRCASQIYMVSGTPIVNYCDVQGWTGRWGGIGNIYFDASFVDDDGTSWKDAFVDLQDALWLALVVPEVREIRVAQGLYRPAGPGGGHVEDYHFGFIRQHYPMCEIVHVRNVTAPEATVDHWKS